MVCFETEKLRANARISELKLHWTEITQRALNRSTLPAVNTQIYSQITVDQLHFGKGRLVKELL
ncbi:hypothetical protein BZ164_22740 [Pseudomonas veronii]|nr:hypothetical protein BZ164_22740 [Pseudomonas veronii]